MARPKVPMIRSASRGCIFKSNTGTEGSPAVHFCHCAPPSMLYHRPNSVPAQIRPGASASATALWTGPGMSPASMSRDQLLPKSAVRYR